MRDEILIEHIGDYIHVRQSGHDSYEISLDLWRQIVAACDEYDCNYILGESWTTDELSTMDIFDHIEIFKTAGVTREHRIAWVNHNLALTEAFAFVEDVLKNRALVNGGLFPSVAEAKAWLLGGEDM